MEQRPLPHLSQVSQLSRCGAKTRAGTPCGRHPVRGRNRCRLHGGLSPRMNAHALPRGCGPLLVAELVARGLDCFARDSVDIPRIVRRVQLPAFKYDAHHPYVWPRSSSVDAGSLMFRAISELGSRTA